MYEYMSEVDMLINEMIDTFGINAETSLPFYKGRICSFFDSFTATPSDSKKPLDALTYYDVEMYLKTLQCSNAEKLNTYNALKRFFEYTYLKGITKEIMSQVTKPIYTRKPKETLNENEYIKMRNYIVCRNNDIKERLVLGLFLFTGLSRKYIANLRNNELKFENGVYELIIWKDNKELRLPLKSELQLIINEYCASLPENELFKKVIKTDENYLSEYVSSVAEHIISRRCTPTILSNTFISKALTHGNHIFEVSKLTLESVTTIVEHIKDDRDLINKQKSILNSF